MRRFQYLLMIILLSLCAHLFSDVEVTAFVNSNKIGIDERFQLIIEVSGATSGDVDQPLLPNIPFENLGMSQSSSTSITVVNSKMTSIVKKSFIYTLQAQQTGQFKIPPISVKVSGKVYKTNGIDLEVVKGSTSRSNQNQGRPTNNNFKSSSNINEDDIIFVAKASKTNLYKNESFIVDYILYTKYNLQLDRLGEEPNFSGFWKEDISGKGNIQMVESTYNGKKYYALNIRKLLLSPNKTGQLKIPSLKIYTDVILPSSGFFGFGTTRSISVDSKPISIKVKELPKADADFSGAVGKFKIHTSITPNSLKAGETATYEMIISGNGNLNQVINPAFPEISKLKVLGPETEMSYQSNESVKTLKYSFLPQEEGLYIIPSVNFIYFDPDRQSYVTLNTPEYKLQVERGNVVLTTSNNQKVISEEGSDIGFIITDFDLVKYKILVQTSFFWMIILLVILTIPIHYFYKLEQDKLSSNLDYLRNRTANRILKKYLNEASFSYKHNQKDQFYDSAYKGLLQYLTDKLAISRGSTKTEVFEQLKTHLSDDHLYDELNQFLENCSAYKYMPNTENLSNLHRDYHHLKNIISDLTKKIK